MLTVFTDKHRLRDARTELSGGLLLPPFEKPERAETILSRVRTIGLGDVIAPSSFGIAPILAVHDKGLVEFLGTAWEEWVAEGYQGEIIPICYPARRMTDRRPTQIDGKVGYYALGSETSISKGTYEAALASVDVALTGAKAVADGAASAFALCRPPGHHAAMDLFGGYCFFNNVAIAAQYLRDRGLARIAILDVDFHHGNGTQDIFYGRDDVLFVSLHGDPVTNYPFFSGYADERGSGAGEGFTINYSLPSGTDFAGWNAALADGIDRIRAYGPDVVLVSLGVDTFEGDPISHFKLKSDDFLRYGEAIGRLGLPTLFVMEGGYAVAEIGINACNVLTGFEDARR